MGEQGRGCERCQGLLPALESDPGLLPELLSFTHSFIHMSPSLLGCMTAILSEALTAGKPCSKGLVCVNPLSSRQAHETGHYTHFPDEETHL